MSYLNLVEFFTQYCDHFAHPRILEIGIDKGQTAIPLLHNLIGKGQKFNWVGVDVRYDATADLQMMSMRGIIKPPNEEWNCAYTIMNSLDYMPRSAMQNNKFDLILIDGDHNYATVTKELSHIRALSHEASLVVIDDYQGKWSLTDMFYVNRETHKDNELLDRPEVTKVPGKMGVKQAVDDWLSENADWIGEVPLPSGDAIVLSPNYLRWTYSVDGHVNESTSKFTFPVSIKDQLK